MADLGKGEDHFWVLRDYLGHLKPSKTVFLVLKNNLLGVKTLFFMVLGAPGRTNKRLFNQDKHWLHVILSPSKRCRHLLLLKTTCSFRGCEK